MYLHEILMRLGGIIFLQIIFLFLLFLFAFYVLMLSFASGFLKNKIVFDISRIKKSM